MDEEVKETVPPLTIKNKYSNMLDYFGNCLLQMSEREKKSFELSNVQELYTNINYKVIGKPN